MSYKLWDVSEDGEIEYVSLTKDKLEGSLEVMRKSFFVDENVAIAVELHKSPKAIAELEELSLNAARDGVSVIAVEKSTGTVAGVAFNKLQVLDSDQSSYFETYISQCKEDSSKALIQFMIDADGACDLFKELNVDCMLEIMFLATSPAFRKRGVGKKLCEATINLARSLKNEEYVKIPITEEALPQEPVPQAVSAIFTSFITQKIGQSLGFKKSIEISYEKFHFQGKTFASRIEPSTPTTTVEYVLV